jgi:poly(ADP-ribose) glycohydrolase
MNLREFARLIGVRSAKGLALALQGLGLSEDQFAHLVSGIWNLAKMLEVNLPALELPKLRQGQQAQVEIPKDAAASLLAFQFLCLLEREDCEALPLNIMKDLHTSVEPQEVAKLQMFLNFFIRRITKPATHGSTIQVYRVAREEKELPALQQCWQESAQPLLPLEVEEPMIGFEHPERGAGLLHADFANMFLGGGVFSGGCVQEEIRFAICPENCVAMLICPCLMPSEAILVIGAEQFNAYTGYMGTLKFAGDFHEPEHHEPAITAMDAFDWRYSGRAAHVLANHLQLPFLIRDLEKAAAAFTPVPRGSA